MRRLLSITAFALFLTVPVWAQRGGGHAGGFGGARGFSGGHSSGGMHSGFSRGIPSTRGVHSSGFNGRHNGFHSRFGNHFSNCFGAFCGHPGFGNRFGNPLRNCVGALCGSRFGSPWRRSGWGWGWGGWGWGWGGYDPWLWSSWDYDDSRFDRDYYNDLAVAEDWNEENLAENTYRQQQADREQDAYARRSYSRQSTQPQPSDLQQQANVPPTVLIFRDQHQKEVTNYAIVGQTLWNFTPQRREKIPLADLDIPATVKANDDRGVSFTVPVPHEGQ